MFKGNSLFNVGLRVSKDNLILAIMMMYYDRQMLGQFACNLHVSHLKTPKIGSIPKVGEEFGKISIFAKKRNWKII